MTTETRVLTGWMSTSEVASVLGVTPERVIKLANKGRIPHCRTPLGRLFAEGDVMALKAERAARKSNDE